MELRVAVELELIELVGERRRVRTQPANHAAAAIRAPRAALCGAAAAHDPRAGAAARQGGRLKARLELCANIAQPLADDDGVADDAIDAVDTLFENRAVDEQLTEEIHQVVELAQLQAHAQVTGRFGGGARGWARVVVVELIPVPVGLWELQGRGRLAGRAGIAGQERAQ